MLFWRNFAHLHIRFAKWFAGVQPFPMGGELLNDMDVIRHCQVFADLSVLWERLRQVNLNYPGVQIVTTVSLPEDNILQGKEGKLS